MTQFPTPETAPPSPDVVVVGGGSAPWEALPPQVFLLMVIAIVAGAVMIFAPLVRAWARRIEGTSVEKARGELADLRERVEGLEQRGLTTGEVDASYRRMYELEERVEFVERLLANGRKVNDGS
jgi:hypothetical protein